MIVPSLETTMTRSIIITGGGGGNLECKIEETQGSFAIECCEGAKLAKLCYPTKIFNYDLS